MKKNYIVLLLTILFSGIVIAQETQKNFINYQGVARNADNALMVSEAMTINIALKFGTANTASIYDESHAVTTDANGVFSLLIGNGSPAKGDYNALPWGSAATFVTVSMNGNEIGTTEMMSVPYAISSGKAVDQSAGEVLYDNSASGLSATTAQEAIDELITGGSIDADADPTNELQTISFNSSTSELSLSDGNTILIPTDGTDADADPTNEIQNLSFNVTTNELSLTDGGTVTIPSGGTDADADPANELQTLSFDASTNALSLSDGNSVTIPSGGTDADADPTNEIQTISFDAASNKISLTDGGEITIPSGGTDADADPTNEIQTLAFDAGTNELSLSEGNTIVIPTGGVDGDGDSTNEFQTISFDVATNELSLSDGGSVTIPSGGTDADADPTNEIQDISLVGTELSISDGSTIDLAPIVPTGGTDNQNLTFNEATKILEIEDGNTVDLSSLSGGGGSSLWNEEATHIYSNNRVGINTRGEIPKTLFEIAGIPGVSEDVGFTNALFTITDNEISGGPFQMVMGGSSIQTLAEGVPSRMYLNSAGGGVGMRGLLDIDGDLRIQNLSGTGQRNVMADADGNLVIGASGAGSPSGLETLEEGLGFGWRLIGRNPANFGSIGFNAIDMSTSNSASSEKGATGNHSFATGENTEASGEWSTAMGKNTRALKSYSIAMGDGSIANGAKSTAMGFTSEANGLSSTAMGFGTKADGYYSTAIGFRTISGSYASTSIGHYNVGASGDILAWQPTDPLFEIGNGEFGARRNALMILKNGNMGVGNITPTTTLDIDGRTRIRDLSGSGQRNVMADADGNLVIGAGGGGSSLWTENGSNVYRTGGSVGIGTIPDTNYQFHVNGGILFDTRFLKFDGGTQKQWTQYIDPVNGSIGFGAHMSDTEAFSPRLKLARTGELELGTASRREAWLHVPKNSTLSKPHLKLEETEADYARLEFKNSSQGFWHIAGRGGSTGDASRLNFYHHNGTVGRDYMTIAGSGNVGIGGSSPTARLHIFQGGQEIEKGLRFSDGINQDWTVAHGFGLSFYYGGNFRAAINANNGAYIQASDARLKSNIKTLSPVLEKVKQLRPSTYFYNSDEKQNITVGLIAQDVQPLFPELVSSSGEEKILGIDYSTFSVVAIKAIQEQQTIIDKQSMIISNLEKRLKRLETKMGQ